jgi:hypothetical protein
MRSLLLPALAALSTALFACGSENAGDFTMPPCDDDVDNDEDGLVDFPDDPGCTSESDDSEDSVAAPQCKDGRDNDGDGKTDYPSDPGCYATHQDDEADDCPSGAGCPQCSDGMDNDENGKTDWPDDVGGCAAASDSDEYTRNPAACGSNVKIEMLPFDGVISGNLATSAASSLVSPMCGGAGIEAVYELRVKTPKVVVATTEFAETSADTVLYIRGANCMDMASEMSCNNDVSTTDKKSKVTHSISTPGTYYLVVDSATSNGGSYKVSVKFLTGEGEECSGMDDCGPGLVCRVPGGGNKKVCSKHVCEDTIDDDGDGKLGFPSDPGCVGPTDGDEADSCPGVGPNCPECGDGVDNDADGKTDYGTSGDTTCTSASSASEACVATDGVMTLSTAATMDTTVGAVNDGKPACATTGTHSAPDKTYRIDVPPMQELTIDNTMTFDGAVALYNNTCTGTAINCKDEPETLTMTNLAAGTYYYVVDGWSSGSGAYTINISGKIQNGASCESPLAIAGAITCGTGYTCKGTMGSRTCQPSQCLDGMDNDSDGKTDYPYDPGCADPGDNSETNPGTAPVCSNGSDDDTDQTTDYPADFGCASAAGTTEKFCMPETDPAALITASATMGTTVGAAADQTQACATSTAPEKSYALQLPVPVQTLTLGTTGFDTVLAFRSLDCATMIACDDEGGVNFGESLITLSNVAPGGYAVVVDGWSTNSGAFTLNVKGTVAPGTPCSSPLFSGGMNAVLACPMNTTCTGTPAKCQ